MGEAVASGDEDPGAGLLVDEESVRAERRCRLVRALIVVLIGAPVAVLGVDLAANIEPCSGYAGLAGTREEARPTGRP
jgi:hypothetical protein